MFYKTERQKRQILGCFIRLKDIKDKTERQKRQILGCFIRQKDRKDRYWDVL